MFDVGFFELLVISTLGLLILGPERLPRVARTAGQWVARARGALRRFQRDIERELAVEEVRERFAKQQADNPPPPPPAGTRPAAELPPPTSPAEEPPRAGPPAA